MSKKAAKFGGGNKNTVYHFIRELIQDGEHARFVDRKGRFLIEWEPAVELYIQYRAQKNSRFDTNIDRKRASNSLREALLHRYSNEANGAKEYEDGRKFGGNNKVVERQFQMPLKVFHSLFGSSVELPSNQEENSKQCPLLPAQVENLQISGIALSSDSWDSGLETCGISQVGAFEEGSSNLDIQVLFPMQEDLQKTYQDYESSDNSTFGVPFEAVPESEEAYHSAEQEKSNYSAEQGNLIQKIGPSSGPVEGGGNFLITVSKELPDCIDSGCALFGSNQAELRKLNKFTFEGIIPAAQQPGEVRVLVYSDTNQFLGETNFEYEDMMDRVVYHAVQLGSVGVSKLFNLMGKHSMNMWNQSSSVKQISDTGQFPGETTFKYEDLREKVVSQAVEQGRDGLYDLFSLIGKHAWNRSLSRKQNAEQATGALNGSCQKRSLSAENTVTDDEYKDLGQHFQDIVTWLSEESFHPSHSNTDVWLKLSEAFYGLCKKLDFAGDEQNFTGDQHASPQGSEDSYFADTETSSCTSSNSASQSDPEDWSQLLNVSSLSLPLPNTKPGIPKIAVPRSEPTEHLDKVSDKETNESHEILALLTGFISQPSVHETLDDGNEKHPRWNTSSSEPQRIDDNLLNDDHNAVEDITKKCELSSEERNPYIHSTLLESAPMFSDTIVPEKESGKNVHSRWEILSMEPNKTDGGVEEDTFDTEQDLSLEQGLFFEEGNVHTYLSLPDDTSVQIHRLEVENEESQEEQIQVSNQFSTDSEQSGAHITPPPVCSNASDIPKMIPMTLPLALQPNLPTGDSTEQMNCSTLLSRLKSLKISGKDKESQKSHEQAYTETFPVKGSLSGQLLRLFRSLKTRVSAKEASVSAVTKDNQQHTPVTVGASDDQLIGDISIIEAAEKGYSDTVRRLIEKGADVDQRGRVDTPLTAAAKNGYTDIVRLLIENGADINKEEWHSGDTALTAAAKNGYFNIVMLLKRNGADVNKENGRSGDTALTAAAKNGDINIVRLLTRNGADVNKENGRSGDTALTAAAKNGDINIVRLLTRNGADVNKKNGCFGDTPLTAAAKNGHTDIVRLLIKNGADVNNEYGCFGDTPLTAAAKNGHTDIVRLLTKNGADVNKENVCFGVTPLTAAAKNGHTDIVRLLTKNGADVNKENVSSGDTPLTAAAKNGHSDIVRLLIENGADFNKEYGCTRYGELLMKERLRSLRKKFEADARDTKLLLERDVDVQLRGKKTASLPKRPGKKLKTQTEMTSPRDVVEEAKRGTESMTVVEFGLNCLHLSARCEQFKPCIMEESPGESSITRRDFKPISKRMNRLILTAEDDAKQGGK